MPDTTAFSQEVLYLPVWMIRLAQDEQVRARMLLQPMVFGSWYEVAGHAVEWPQEVKDIQEAERARELSFDRALDLLDKMNLAFRDGSDLEQARQLLEAYAVHEWVRKNPAVFEATLSDNLQAWEALVARGPYRSAQPSKLKQLVDALGFEALHAQLLSLAVLSTASRGLERALDSLTKERSRLLPLWSRMLGCEMQALEYALGPQSPLTCSQLLQTAAAPHVGPRVSPFWVQLLQGVESSLFDVLLQPLQAKAAAGVPAQLSEADESMALQLLKNATEPGVNLLLYGADGMDRRAPVQKLLSAAQRKGFVLQALPNAGWRDMPSIHFVAQRLLHSQQGADAVLVVERSTEVLDRRPSEFILQMLDLTFDEAHIRPFDELMLSTNPAPCIWVGPGSNKLSAECIGRMVFHAPLNRARREERRRFLEATLKELKLGASVRQQLLGLEEVSALQLQTAVRAAKLAGLGKRDEREKYILQAIKRSLAALQRQTQSTEKECVTQYSLKYVNYAGRFGPEQILKAFSVKPKGSLCLYGPPGTGKTQFVEHLSRTLGLRLRSYRASDLLSKYVGESEQNIAKMFQDAAAEDCVLFIDEADSFLRDRTLAQHSWEVTKVNELLQHMERYEGIFVVATNLFKQLDLAALRRFTFKLEFHALDADQRWEMFVNEAGLKGKLSQYSAKVKDEWLNQLVFMAQLTAGDFAVVKKQALLLGLELKPEDWLQQLKVECELKSRAT